MLYRQLSNTDLKLSALGIGTWAIGAGDWKYSWGSQDDKDSIEAIHYALDHGVNWIDTAAVYGIGHAEEIIKKALSSTQHKPLIATKCGLLQDKKKEIYSDISQKSILKEVEGSLSRLGVDVIDIYQIHWPNPTKDIEEAFQTLLDLVKAGKIRYPAVSNFSLDQLKRISKLGLPVSLQSPFSLVRQELSYEIIPWCMENNVSVLAYSPLQCGMFTEKLSREWIENLPANDWRKSNKYFKEPLITKIFKAADELKNYMSDKHPAVKNPVMAAALNWVIYSKGITSAIAGMRNRVQAEELINSLEFKPAAEEIKNIAQCFSEI